MMQTVQMQIVAMILIWIGKLSSAFTRTHARFSCGYSALDVCGDIESFREIGAGLSNQ